jgi:hypothetical protein
VTQMTVLPNLSSYYIDTFEILDLHGGNDCHDCLLG